MFKRKSGVVIIVIISTILIIIIIIIITIIIITTAGKKLKVKITEGNNGLESSNPEKLLHALNRPI